MSRWLIFEVLLFALNTAAFDYAFDSTEALALRMFKKQLPWVFVYEAERITESFMHPTPCSIHEE